MNKYLAFQRRYDTHSAQHGRGGCGCIDGEREETLHKWFFSMLFVHNMNENDLRVTCDESEEDEGKEMN